MQDVLEREPTTDNLSKALTGAAAGAIGTWALDRADWGMWKHESEASRLQTKAVRPKGEPPAHVIATKVEKALGLNPTPEQHEIAGLAVHYGLGIGPAIIYSLIRDKLPGQGPVRGALYGLGLFVMQDEVLNTATGLGADPRRYPWQAHARGLIAHLVYGMATEMALDLMDRAERASRLGVETGREPQGEPRGTAHTKTAASCDAAVAVQP